MNAVKIITHSGSFHADDVFAVATVILSLPREARFIIIRTRDEDVIGSGDYVVDVGRIYNPKKRRFDHHQAGGAGKRENSIPYASFGLVWEEYGARICAHDEVKKAIDEKLVYYIDAIDNGVAFETPIFEDLRSYTISDYLYSYWVDEDVEVEEIDAIFYKAVLMAKDLLEREIRKATRILMGSRVVEEIYNNTSDKRLIILDKHYAWGKILSGKPEPLVVVYPDTSGESWRAKSVRVSFATFEQRIKWHNTFPRGMGWQKWQGARGNKHCRGRDFLP